MSDSISKAPEAIIEPVVEPKEDFVPKKAYEETKADLFKFKARAKELEAKANQLQADAEARDKQVLKDNEQWKALYEKTQADLETTTKRAREKDEQFVNIHKRNSVLKEIGGFKRDEYTRFINVDNVEMDESGSIIPESLASEVNRIKQAYPELLKSTQAQNLPNGAPKAIHQGEKSLSDMSPKERADLKMKLLMEQQNKK